MSENEPTIFDDIIAGRVPCHRVYEDEHVLAFLDIGPLSRGHTLVVPKESKPHLHELSEESAAAIGRALPRIARGILEATGATAYNVLQNNGRSAHQAVMHVHFHIIPKYDDPDVEHDGLGLRWNAGEIDNEEAADLADQVEAKIKEFG